MQAAVEQDAPCVSSISGKHRSRHRVLVDSPVMVVPSQQNSPGCPLPVSRFSENIKGTSKQQVGIIIPVIPPDEASRAEEISRRQRRWCGCRPCRPDEFLHIQPIRNRIGKIPSFWQVRRQFDGADACGTDAAEQSAHLMHGLAAGTVRVAP
jgi:hypothetical protein